MAAPSAPTVEHERARARHAGGIGDLADRLAPVILWALLVSAALAVLLPAVVLGAPSSIFAAKVLAAILLSVLPGWVYLQFIKSKGRSLYDEYVLNLFRLHIDEYRNLPAPPQHTSYYRLWRREHNQLGATTKDNLYRRKFESVYGRSSVSTVQMFADCQTFREKTETLAPVLLATLLLCLGWVLVLRPELMMRVNFLRVGPPSGRLILPSGALRFGFLGAYCFVIQDVMRRYFREDLRAAAYISAITRVVFVPIVVLALDAVWPVAWASQEAAFAFLVGFFPQVGLQAIQAAVARPLRSLMPSLRSDHPLSELDGFNIWYEARLAEEGIEDMQNLVSASLVDLMLRSRAPVSRLTDWIDQAYLCLHLPPAEGDGEQPGRSMRSGLRRLGIRTATDLERSWADLQGDPDFCAALSEALGVEPEQGPAIVKAMIRTFQGEVNLWHVREFKKHEWLLRDAARQSSGDVEVAGAAADREVVSVGTAPR